MKLYCLKDIKDRSKDCLIVCYRQLWLIMRSNPVQLRVPDPLCVPNLFNHVFFVQLRVPHQLALCLILFGFYLVLSNKLQDTMGL